MTVPDLVLGIDIGTSSTKAVLADAVGRVIRTASVEHGLSSPRPGWMEQDADAVWWADAVRTGRIAVGAEGASVRAVCATGLGPCIVPSGQDGGPLRPAILYGIDSRAGGQIDELNRAFGEDAIVERCGSPLSTQAVGPKALWIQESEPAVWDRAVRVHDASSWITWRLSGAYVLDHHSASQWVPMYDIRRRCWIPDWFERCAPGVQPPALAWPGEAVGRLRPDAAAAIGLPAGTPVVCGTIDAWAEAESAGVDEPGDLMLMYGTTFFLVCVTGSLIRHPALWTTNGVRAGVTSLAGGLATSGSVTAWLRDLSGLEYEHLTALAEAAPVGAGGLIVLPYFAGERTPIADPDARGLIVGLTLAHGIGEVYRAVLEGTAFAVRHNVETLEAAGAPIRRLVAVGGGTRHPLWSQIVSDVLGRVQEVPEVTLGAAYGAARLAATGIGLASPTERWARTASIVEPRAELLRRYDDLYAIYRSLYPATSGAMHALARVQAA